MRRQKRARERQEKRQATNFKGSACCPSAVVQRASRRKNGLCEGSVRGNWDPRKDQQPSQPNPNEVGDRTTTLRRLLRSAADALSIAHAICKIMHSLLLGGVLRN